jgi:hypothetical protein
VVVDEAVADEFFSKYAARAKEFTDLKRITIEPMVRRYPF